MSVVSVLVASVGLASAETTAFDASVKNHIQRPVGCPDGAGQDRILGRLERFAKRSNIAVSTDGRSILYVRTVSSSVDLMLIENFR